jgi:hypothetical protein
MLIRVLLSGVLGGIFMFAWQFVAHGFLPLGEMGKEQLPDERAVRSTLDSTISESGLYYFPRMEDGVEKLPFEEKMKAWERQKSVIAAGTSGIVVVRVRADVDIYQRFSVQLGIDIIACIFAAMLLGSAAGSGLSYLQRVFFMTLLGLTSAVVVNLPYWNWYGFPEKFVIGQLIEHTVGFFAAGIIMAAIIRRRAGAAATTAPATA